jgi:hypothetical protein
MFVSFTLTLLALVAAQLDPDQHAAVRTLLTDLGCTPPTCPNFAANESCPGVLACSNGRVNYISLTIGVRRTGSINGTALGVLTGLTSLQLFNLNLTTIPTQVGRLSALTALILSSSALIGTVPTEVANLANLETLNVNGNKLTGTLPALDKLTKLTSLSVGSNVGIGGNMPAMPTSIRSISVENCAFTGLPPNLSGLTLLLQLRVHQNKLSGAPPVVSPWVSLCILQINNADTNCFDCPASGAFGPCVCAPNPNATACASLATTTTVAAPPVTSQSATSFTTASTTTVRATSGTNMTASTAPAISTPAPTTTSATNPASIGGLSTTATAPSSGEPEPWIVGVIVGGAALALILVGAAVFFLLKRRPRKPPAEKPAAAEMKQPQSNYAAINVAPPREYDEGRLDSNDEPAPSNYAVIPAKSSDYDNGPMNVDDAAAASDYHVGRL